MKILSAIDTALARVEKIAIVFCFSMLLIAVIFTIFTRNILHVPSYKILETAPALLLWLCLLGASHALKEKRHIRLELVLRYCSENVRRWAAVLSNLFGAVVMALLFYTSLEFVSNEIDMFGRWGITAIIFPLFFLFTCFRFCLESLVCLYPFTGLK